MSEDFEARWTRMRSENFARLVGQTVTEIRGGEVGSDRMEFDLADGRKAALYHEPDCCETVELEDVAGDLADLIGSPLLIAELVTNSEDNPPEHAESFTWSFYKLATVKGHVTLRWLGESNGYYSEIVQFDLPEASAIEARSGETGTGSTEGESATRQGDAQ